MRAKRTWTGTRILVTGSRSWGATNLELWAVHSALVAALPAPLPLPSDVAVVTGGARGLDLWAEECARSLGWLVETHPADWERHGRSAGILRNKAMVELGADCCLAFPTDDSVGTWHCARLARWAGIPVRIHLLPGQLAATKRAEGEQQWDHHTPLDVVTIGPNGDVPRWRRP